MNSSGTQLSSTLSLSVYKDWSSFMGFKVGVGAPHAHVCISRRRVKEGLKKIRLRKILEAALQYFHLCPFGQNRLPTATKDAEKCGFPLWGSAPSLALGLHCCERRGRWKWTDQQSPLHSCAGCKAVGTFLSSEHRAFFLRFLF